MVKKVIIPANKNNKALAFFAELDKRKEAARIKFSEKTTKLRDELIKKSQAN